MEEQQSLTTPSHQDATCCPCPMEISDHPAVHSLYLWDAGSRLEASEATLHHSKEGSRPSKEIAPRVAVQYVSLTSGHIFLVRNTYMYSNKQTYSSGRKNQCCEEAAKEMRRDRCTLYSIMVDASTPHSVQNLKEHRDMLKWHAYIEDTGELNTPAATQNPSCCRCRELAHESV